MQGVKRPEQWLCVASAWVIARLRRVAVATRGATAPQAAGEAPWGGRVEGTGTFRERGPGGRVEALQGKRGRRRAARSSG